MKKKKVILLMWKSLAIIFGSVVIGYLLLVAVYMLPMEKTKAHLEATASILEQEGTAHFMLDGFDSTFIDDFTDGVMINTATCTEERNPFVAAAASQQYQFEQKDMFQSFLAHASGEKGAQVYNYALYWHGYQIFLKPLLFIGEISTIRLLNMLVQLALAGILGITIWRKMGGEFGISFLITYFFWTPITLFMCMQFSDIYYISVIAMIVLLRYYEMMKEKKWLPYFFLLIGIVTAYFDLLTYPVVALGLPLVLLILLESRQHQLIGKQILCVIGYSVSWSVGYLGMWLGKWIIASFLTNQNVMQGAFNEILYRTSGASDTEQVSRLGVIRDNIGIYAHRVYYLVILIFLIYIVVRVWKMKSRIKADRIRASLSYAIPLCMVAMYPFVWYVLTTNHSYIHTWMVHKELIITVFAGTSLLTRLTLDQSTEIREDISRK